MPRTDPCLFACFACLSILLHGCGGGSGPNKPPAQTTVIVMRHCVRATNNDGIVAQPTYENYSDYTSREWPGFGVDGMHCTPRGKQIVEAQGRWFKSQGGLPLPLRAIADNVTNGQRDQITMLEFLKGLAPDAQDLTTRVDHAPFAPGDSAACMQKKLNYSALMQAQDDFIKANPPPADYKKNMHKLFEVLGIGSAGSNWTDVPCLAGRSPWGNFTQPEGGCYAASQFVERFLMEWGSGLPVAWNRISTTDLPPLMSLHTWDFFITFACPALYKWYGASMIRDISAKLVEAEPGTTLYVGHDNDIMQVAGALGLSWEAKPFPAMATLPGSMLRFDRKGDSVTASYHYVDNFTFSDKPQQVPMRSAPVFFSDSRQISLEGFQKLVEQGSFVECTSSSSDLSSRNSFPFIV